MVPECLHIKEALREFALSELKTQSQGHIKPMHHYISLRLVIEGGFLPEEITPRPPLRATRRSGSWVLQWDESAAGGPQEMTVMGGMKTKKIDVVVAKPGIGPVMAVSVKGTCNAYRNLTNRMEEAIGDSTNLHVMYPGLVYGFLHLVRANRQENGYAANDVGIAPDGSVSPQIQRYYGALCEMTGRRFVRNDYTRYESVGLALIENDQEHAGEVHPAWPPAGSPLRIESFFQRLFETYDIRFPTRAEDLPITRRVSWLESMPLFRVLAEPLEETLGYVPRLSG